ncbi:histidinol-phosphatase HisJ family protein [Peptacetobacter hominis]|uniref:Histidinol-phosphatase n=1 Tax=Peptacetobacter hominis TaxID=2743610 RepID=A0A544QXC8_9FIRM|nr:histidinol-phosphatase HisJ family protein [Peptacetobacter hominis]TQQ85316.1 histidinol-phosphatase HisJ family protein [Peptacetobacter hominis]
MICDYHTHTSFSDDSVYEMENCINDAIESGIDEICFTDHVDYGIKNDWDMYRAGKADKEMLNVDYVRYFSEIDKMVEKYGDKIKIKKGLEFGVQSHTISDYEKLVSKYNLDFVIMSIHRIDNKGFWSGDFQKGKTEPEYYRVYYDEMYNLVRNFHEYNVLGHMDLIKRYDDKDGYDSFSANRDIIEKILRYIIEDGKGIELNASTEKYGISELMPSKEILSLYHKLGGRIITIGSDSHSKKDIERVNIKKFMNELKKIGFEEFCTFENMKPIFHRL